MTQTWTPTRREMTIIRKYAAASVKLSTRQIEIALNEREAEDDSAVKKISDNLLLVGGEWSERTMLEGSDLHDHAPFESIRQGIDLHEGRAIVDLVVYRVEGFGAQRERGDLEGHVQAWVETINGKPRLTRMTGTLTKPITVMASGTPDDAIRLGASF